MTPKVSVNLCCYNGERFLSEALASVFAQTYTNWELVIVNDGSTDSTDSIIRAAIEKGYPIKYENSAVNRGLSNSRNRCLDLSSGEYIAFLDQDDLWLPEKLAKQVELLDSNSELALIYTDALAFYQESGESFPLFTRKPVRGKAFRSHLCYYNVPLQTVLLRKSILDAVGERFDPNLRLAEDMDIFLRILYRYPVEFSSEMLTKIRFHDKNTSRLFIKDWPAEMEIILEKFLSKEPGFSEEYSDEINIFRSRIALRRAIPEIEAGNGQEARKHLRPYLSSNYKYWVVYLATFFPSRLYWTLYLQFRKYAIFGINN